MKEFHSGTYKSNEDLISKYKSQAKASHLYYPSIKFISYGDHFTTVWKVKYKDLTEDRKFIVLFINGEGKFNNFFRFDLPVV